jgi:NAD(P)-dependent dehydrogenase (short-subunit alcohol dehydrogenase family)
VITALVTGANKGIGLELCRQLVQRGDNVLGTCRQASTELRALPVRVFEEIDLTRNQAAVRLARELDGVGLDWLVSNAGSFESSALGQLDFARMTEEYEVNALGPLRVVQALLPNFRPLAKIALVSSRAGSIEDNSSGGIYGYRMAKAALNMAGVSLTRDLESRGIAVVILHPGVVDTDTLRSAASALGQRAQPADVVPPSVAARELVQRIDELTLETSGRFLHRNGQELPW